MAPAASTRPSLTQAGATEMYATGAEAAATQFGTTLPDETELRGLLAAEPTG